MPSVTYDFTPGQSVYVITNGQVKAGTVTVVKITVDTSGTEVKYWILVSGATYAMEFGSDDVFATCQSAAGYLNIVFTTNLEGSPSPEAIDGGSPIAFGSPAPTVGSPSTEYYLSATVYVDGTPITLTHAVTGGETYAELVDEINTQLGTAATASIVDNNIRITSATKGATSSVRVDGSPQNEDYFRFLNNFTGLAAPVAGKAEGAIEELATRVC